MIVIVRKSNILLVLLVMLLSVTLFSLNWSAGETAKPVASGISTEKVVLLDPGHGGEDPGAVSIYSGIREKDINLNVALKLKEMLEKESYKVLMTRSEDVLVYEPGTKGYTNMRDQDLNRRKKIIDASSADIVVSIHMNKLDEKKLSQYFGAQTFYPPASPESKKLAVIIQNSLKELVDSNNKREALEKKVPKGDIPIIIFRDIKKTSVIVECGFFSNVEEEKKLGTKEYQEKLATGIKDGIKKYFEGK